MNQSFDEGEIIFQDQCEIDPDDTADSLSKKIHQLEYANYPTVSEGVIMGAGKK